MTVRVPRWLLLGVLLLALLAAAAYAGLRVGEDRGRDDAQADARAAAARRADTAATNLQTHHIYEVEALRRLCFQAAKLRSPFNGERMDTRGYCRSITPFASRPPDIYAHDSRTYAVISHVCENIAVVNGGDATESECGPDAEPLRRPETQLSSDGATDPGP